MDSITKRHISSSTLDRLVKHVFGSNVYITQTEYNNAGWFNTIYILSLSSGDDIVLKIFPSPEVRVMRYERNIMQVEVECMRMIYKDNIVPVPEILYYDNSGELLGSEFYIMRKLEGCPFGSIRNEFPKEKQSELDILMGQCCRKLNNIHNDRFGYYSNNSEKHRNWRDAFSMFIIDALEDGQDYNVKLALDYEDIYNLMMGSDPDIYNEVTTPSLVHWDLHDGNVFVNDHGKITGILDFERAIWADPLMELNFGVQIYKDDFNIGYGFDRQLTPNQKFRRAAYDLYLDLIMVVECYYREYNNEGHEKWCRWMFEREMNTLKDTAMAL